MTDLVTALRIIVDAEAEAPTEADKALVNGIALALKAYDQETAKLNEAIGNVLEHVYSQAMLTKADREGREG